MVRVFLVFSSCLFTLAIAAWGATYSPSFEKCVTDHQSQKRGDEPVNLHQTVMTGASVPVLLRCEGTFVDENANTFTAVATVFLTLVTGGLVFVGYRQIQTSRQQLRAYVFIEDALFQMNPGGGEAWYIHIAMKNFGSTPAYKATIKAEHSVMAPIADDALLPLGPQAKTYPTLAIAPGNCPTVRIHCPELMAGKASWALAAKSEKKAYVWGRIEYFSFNQQRSTTFQMVCHFGAAANFTFCQNGNDAN